MTQEPNDDKLKRAMAKLLPEQVQYHCTYNGEPEAEYVFKWLATKREVLETEWLSIIAMVEEKLEGEDIVN